MDKVRLLTKSDFDGVLCAALLKTAGMIDDIVFVNNFDFENGKIDINEKDISCNLPYSNKVAIAFSYGKEKKAENHISYLECGSCSQAVYKYCQDKLGNINKQRIDKLLSAVIKANNARFTKNEILSPKGFDMLNFLLDSRTGIGRVRAFKISNYALMVKLVDLILEKDIDQILELDDIKERIEYYQSRAEDYKEMLEFCAREENNILIVDLRNETYVKPANRFVKFAMYPEAKFAIQIMWGLRKMNTVFGVGKSIFNKDENIDLENILKKYGGISRKNSGSLQVKSDNSDLVLKELILELKS